MRSGSKYKPSDSFLRVATACPVVSVADVAANIAHIKNLYAEAASRDVSLLTFPELCITGYTLGDLVHQQGLLDQAREGCLDLAALTQDKPTAMIVGLPLQVGNRLYNCAAVLADGRVQGIVPKTHRPTYNEFYEQRWFDAWQAANITVQLGDQEVVFGTDLLFEIGGVICGVEICEDLWVLQPPSIALAQRGALVVANPSASPEQIGKSDYRRQLVTVHSAKMFGAYLYAGSDASESTAEIVMSGQQLIAVNGQLVAQHGPFGGAGLTVTDVDIDHLLFDRRKQHAGALPADTVVHTDIKRQQTDLLSNLDRNPFLPGESDSRRSERLESALQIQAYGLAMRMRASNQQRLVLGLSGGLDSTLALIVAHRAVSLLHLKPSEAIYTLTMPGPASSDDTQNNAQLLAKALRVKNTVIPISDMVRDELAALAHDGKIQDITYENVQARARTSLLFNYANQHGAMVLGTGDLSEIALGWCTYNADQQSHYNVNASIPKTLVRHLVAYAAHQPEYKAAARTLQAILETIVSPELTKTVGGDLQSTEELIGPYELHDFFLYHLVRWGDMPVKIKYLANQVFDGTYSTTEIDRWLEMFVTRFARNQFKRETMPNGPKVGSVALSPRGDWRMPPDLQNPALWH